MKRGGGMLALLEREGGWRGGLGGWMAVVGGWVVNGGGWVDGVGGKGVCFGEGGRGVG